MKETLHNIAAGLHDRFLDRELDHEALRWLDDHRARCAACDASFTRLERLTATLTALERPDPGRGFADRVLAEVRPAPAPFWARWQLTGAWSRAAAAALLVVAGLGALLVPDLLGGALGVAGPTTLFRGPGLLASGVVAVLDWLDPFRALTETVAVLGKSLLAGAGSPQVLTILSASAAVSAGALVELSKILAVPQRRPASHA
jgi:hypothetical protein